MKYKKSLPTFTGGQRCYKIQIQLNENIYAYEKLLYYTLCHHGVSYLHEACNVRTLYIIDVTISFCTILHTLFVNAEHDAMQFFVYFSSTPA